MNIDILHNWVLLRVLFIFAVAAASLTILGIVTWYKAWRDMHRNNEARTPESSSSKQGTGNAIESVA